MSEINITRIDRHFASQVSEGALYATGLTELVIDEWTEFIALDTRLSPDTAPPFDTARSIRAL